MWCRVCSCTCVRACCRMKNRNLNRNPIFMLIIFQVYTYDTHDTLIAASSSNTLKIITSILSSTYMACISQSTIQLDTKSAVNLHNMNVHVLWLNRKSTKKKKPKNITWIMKFTKLKLFWWCEFCGEKFLLEHSHFKNTACTLVHCTCSKANTSIHNNAYTLWFCVQHRRY